MMEVLYEFCNELLEATRSPTSTPCERKVRFAATDMVVSSDSISPIQQLVSSCAALSWDDACQKIWYTQQELHTFKTDARHILLNKDEMSLDDLRGLERYNYERATYKRRTLQTILDAFHESLLTVSHTTSNNSGFRSEEVEVNDKEANQEMLCQISRKHTKYARRIAYSQGRRDEFLVRRIQQEEREQDVLLQKVNRRRFWQISRSSRSSGSSKTVTGNKPIFGGRKRKINSVTCPAGTNTKFLPKTLITGKF